MKFGKLIKEDYFIQYLGKYNLSWEFALFRSEDPS